MPSLTSLDCAILGLLARGPASGYDIRRVFQSTALGRYSASPGSIYPAIRRLEERALVRGKHDASGRGRTEWHLSRAGRTRLVAWIKQPIAADDLFRDSASVDLRLAFVSDVAPESLPAFLANYAEAAGAYVEILEAARAFVENDISRSASLSFELGVALARARAKWVRQISSQGTGT